MRTRSQPISPGGLVSLEAEPRRRRATRSVSAQPQDTENGQPAEPVPAQVPKPAAKSRKPRGKKATRGKKTAPEPAAEPEFAPVSSASPAEGVKPEDSHEQVPNAGDTASDPRCAEEVRPEEPWRRIPIPRTDYRSYSIEDCKSHFTHFFNDPSRRRISDWLATRALHPKSHRPPPWYGFPKELRVAWEELYQQMVYEGRINRRRALLAKPPSEEVDFDPRLCRLPPRSQRVGLRTAEKRSDSDHTSPGMVEPPLTLTPVPKSRKRPHESLDTTSTKRPKRSGPSPRYNPRASYAEIANRRRVQASGRVDRTLYRLPELLAQNEADEVTNTPSTPQAVGTQESVPSVAANPPATAPPVAETAGWGRWFYNTVSRRWTSFRERFGNRPAVNATATAEPEIPTATAAEEQAEEELDVETPSNDTLFFTPPTSRRILSPKSYHDRRVPRRRRARSNAIPQELFDIVYGQVDPALRPIRLPDGTLVRRPRPEAPPSKKRKRRPSPDRIPNPAGCSYGMDLDYFYFDSEDEKWAEEEQARRDALAKEAAQNFADTAPADVDPPSKAEEPARPASKKAKKVRVEEPPRRQAGPSRRSTSPNAPQQRPGFIPNPHGTFRTPGWSSSSDEATNTSALSNDSRAEPELPKEPSPVAKARDEPVVPKESSPVTRARDEPVVPKEPSPVTRARDNAAQFKPKTPSRLRQVHRFSSSTVFSSSINTPSFLDAEVGTPSYLSHLGNDIGGTPSRISSTGDPMSLCSDAPTNGADWTQQPFPSDGNFDDFHWPAPRPLAEGFGVSPAVVEAAASLLTPERADGIHATFEAAFNAEL
ncbi:hypothetical protein NUU61_003322 [Penicillium alfredii]|uniref:Uncharacterized protein n=1 Tax=Penicillium alfredii TaxID=1506179 RepID=A0A9W9KGT8_9EURO|nr:uncharacterized protein NUU61_003322 [Penicillium alfredii]KAJ5105975.1 hypothetical protein NUU61_003322 [Penicillium alfredii]